MTLSRFWKRQPRAPEEPVGVEPVFKKLGADMNELLKKHYLPPSPAAFLPPLPVAGRSLKVESLEVTMRMLTFNAPVRFVEPIELKALPEHGKDYVIEGEEDDDDDA